MAKVRLDKTSFASGELSPLLAGRTDLQVYSNGAAKLTNVVVHPTGGIMRRAGLRYIGTSPGFGRLLSFGFNTEHLYLLLLTHHRLLIYENGHLISDILSPWAETHLKQLSWTQSADTLLVVHPDVPPKRITRKGSQTWEVSDWLFAAAEGGRIHQPHHKFVNEDVALHPSGTTGVITISAAANTHPFHRDHRGTRFRLDDKEVLIVAVPGTGGVANPENDFFYDKADALVIESLVSNSATKHWTEQAFSAVRGYPICVSFHQDRLVIGGSRELPNRLWLSRSSDLFNFDLGEGLDDHSIEFAILSDQLNAIRAVFSGRHLQVFTSGAEWMVTGDPLTPTNIQLYRQTRIGSATDRNVLPRDIDGATVFVPRNTHQIREFLFTDIEQAYQAADLAILSHHLVNDPIDMDYDPNGRLLYVVMNDGTIGTLTIYRQEQMTAWTTQQTNGLFVSIAVVGDYIYTLVNRWGQYYIEMFDSALNVDSGLLGYAELAKEKWVGLQHLEGRTIKVVAENSVLSDMIVEDGTITLAEPARTVQAGLSYTHIIEPLPPEFPGGAIGQGSKIRPVSITFRFENTYSLRLDTGLGPADVPFHRLGEWHLDTPPVGFTGEKTVRASGWRQEAKQAIWRISQDTPLPFNLLSVTTEIGLSN
jgi:hypothetical protein